MKNVLLIIAAAVIAACGVGYKNNEPDNIVAQIKTIDSLVDVSQKYYKIYNWNTGLFDSYLKQADSLASAIDQNSHKIKIYNTVAKRYRNNSDFAQAIMFYQKSMLLAELINNDSLKAYTTHELAVTLRRMDDNAEALDLHMKALQWAETNNDTFLVHSSLNGIGNVYYSYNNHHEAIRYFKRSLQYLNTTTGNMLGKAINTNNIGEAWLSLGNTDSALFYLNQSYIINVEINSKLGQAICQNGIGNVYLAKNNYPKALEHYYSSLNLNKDIGDLIYTADNYRKIGYVYMLMHNNPKAEENLLKAFTIASEIGSKSQIVEAANLLSQFYINNNLINKALNYKQNAMTYNDSINAEISRQNSLAMEELFKARQSKQEMQIANQKAELEGLKMSRQIFILISIVGVLTISILLGILWFRKRSYNNRISKISLEQKLLRANLNPHFIFNSLAAVQNFIMKNDKKEAADYLVNFSRLMRNILMSSSTDYIQLTNEIEILDDYLRLQRLRFLNHFDYYFEISDNIDNNITLIPSMLVQPFVENSVEHGFNGIDYQGVIIIRFENHNNNLVITVDDNGRGIELNNNNKGKKHVSMAMSITRQRLQTLQTITKKQCFFDIIDKKTNNCGQGVFVKITIPLKTEY